MLTGTTLITGGDGYLGLLTARRLLQRSPHRRVALLVRARDQAEQTRKRARIFSALEGVGYGAQGQGQVQVQVVWGALEDEAPLAAVDTQEIHAVIHTAAVTRFDVDAQTADRVNVHGAETVYRFAATCPHLRSLDLVSTVYASGLTPGRIDEAVLPSEPPPFANHYERSKWAAEQRLVDGYGELPWRIARVATVIADDTTGNVTQRNVFHQTLRLLYHGLLSVVPGDARTPIYLTTGDFAAGALATLAERPGDRSVYHVCHTQAESLTLAALLERVFQRFDEDGVVRQRRLLRPLLVDEVAFRALAGALQGMSTGLVGMALGALAPFAAQLFTPKDLRNDRLRAALAGYAAADPARLVDATVRALIRGGWSAGAPTVGSPAFARSHP